MLLHKRYLIFSVISIFILLNNLYAQKNNDIESLMEMSLEDLLELEIVSASKKAESNFITPLSSTVITGDEIIKAGITTIPEALRLAPGLIVREQTNGIYDIHLRGYDYIPYSSMPYTQNQITLVMIDNRIVFRDFQGGTYWEAIPIEISDIERIEIIRGPSSALYGPNAVAGVINIITKKIDSNENAINETVSLDYQQGSFHSDLISFNSGFKRDKYSINISLNRHERDRYQWDYWDYVNNRYWENPDSCYSPQTEKEAAFRGTGSIRYPKQELAIDKYAINLFNTYHFSPKIDFNLSFGLQHSTVQKIYVDVINTPFTTEVSETEYFDLQSNFYDGYFHLSYLKGYQNTLGVMGWEYNFYDFNLNLEYNFNFFNNRFSIRPGISYREFGIDDSLGRLNSSIGQGLINGNKKLTTVGGSIYSDYSPIPSIRFIAALRSDSYNHPDDKIYLSYQFASTYQWNEKHLTRIVLSKANKGSNILDNYVNFHFISPNTEMHYFGNQNLELMTMNMIETGYRVKLSNKIHGDLELFYSTAENYTSTTSIDSIFYYPIYKINFKSKNRSVRPSQKGITLAFHYVMNENFIFKPYLTWQKTNFKDLQISDINSDSLISEENEYTPEWYGGFYMNIIPSEYLNININSYLMSQTKMKYQYNKHCKINNTWIINSKISYKINEHVNTFINIKNFSPYTDIINNKKEEYTEKTLQFGFADNIQTSIFFGINMNFQ